MSAILSIVDFTILALLFAPFFVMIFGSGFYLEPLKKELAIDILQITFPYLFFVSIVAFSGSVLNSYQKFSLPALTPLFYNLSLIIAALWFAPKSGDANIRYSLGCFLLELFKWIIQIPSSHAD